MSLRSTVPAVLLLLTVGCTGGPAGDVATTVDGVRVEIPDGWEPEPQQDVAGVVGSHRWSPAGDDLHGLQVVVGCDGTVDELVRGTLETPRAPLVLTDADEDRAEPRVPGLDAARRLELTFGAGRPDDAATLRTSGLYGQSGDALVLVEVSQPAGRADEDLAEAVLGSVTVDADTLQTACDARD